MFGFGPSTIYCQEVRPLNLLRETMDWMDGMRSKTFSHLHERGLNLRLDTAKLQVLLMMSIYLFSPMPTGPSKHGIKCRKTEVGRSQIFAEPWVFYVGCIFHVATKTSQPLGDVERVHPFKFSPDTRAPMDACGLT